MVRPPRSTSTTNTHLIYGEVPLSAVVEAGAATPVGWPATAPWSCAAAPAALPEPGASEMTTAGRSSIVPVVAPGARVHRSTTPSDRVTMTPTTNCGVAGSGPSAMVRSMLWLGLGPRPGIAVQVTAFVASLSVPLPCCDCRGSAMVRVVLWGVQLY